MKRKTVIIILLFIVCFPVATVKTSEKTSSIKDEKSFLQEFFKALESKDKTKVNELVSGTEPQIVFNAIISLSNQGINAVAQGKDARIHFNVAGLIATIYARKFKKEALLELVRGYRLYTQEMCKEKLAGDSLFNEGNSFYQKGQWKEAFDKYSEALKIYKILKNVAAEANILNNIGNIYGRFGQYRVGLQYYMQSLEIKRRIGDVAMEASLLDNIGNTYERLGDYQEALNYYERCLEMSRGIRYVAGEARSLGNIGNVYQTLGQYQKALNYYERCLEMSRRIRYIAGEAKSLGNIGLIYNRLSQYGKTLQYYQQSLEIFRKIGDVSGEADSLNNIGIVYHFLGQYREALHYHMQALEIKRRIGDAAGEAKSFAGIGNVYTSLGQFEKALQYSQKSLEIARRIGDVKGEALSLNNIGNDYNRLGQFEKALEYSQKSLDVKRRNADVSGEAYSLNNIGNVYYRLGQYEKAFQPLKESIRLFEHLGVLEGVWRGHVGLGRCSWGSAKREEAIGHYKIATEVIEQIYQHAKGIKEEERSSMIGEKSFVYQEFIELLLELHRKQPTKGYDREAFLISEKAKSRTFQELMAKAGAKIAFSGDETFKKMVDREQQLMGEITNLRGFLTKELSKPERQRNQEVIKPLKDQLSKSEKSLTELEKEIELKYPRYADLKRPKPLSLEELQEILKPDETVIAYSVGKEKSVAFIVTKNRFRLIELSISSKEITNLIKQYRKGLGDVSRWEDLEEFEPKVAYELYQKIFSPLSPELKGVTKLYISADDILYTLPFETLVDKEIDVKAFRQARSRGRSGEAAHLGEYATLHYFIDTYTITYLPSASVLRSLRKYEKPGYGEWGKPLIAFADPIFGSEEKVEGQKEVQSKGISKETDLTIQILTRSTGSEKLERLKESAQEAETIAKELKGKKEDIYLREKATEENIYKTNLKDSRYLLFSTHGLLGGDFSGVAEPALALTLIDNPPGRDGFLTMSEVLGLDLNAELIILSACNTSGRGDKSGSGEGFVGLTRSFMYVGSKSLLVTHWSVESEAARDLMVNTMRLMKSKRRPESLREAKLEMKGSLRPIKDGKLSLSHPFFWAPFVLVGEGE